MSTVSALITWFCLVYLTRIRFDYNIVCKQIKIRQIVQAVCVCASLNPSLNVGISAFWILHLFILSSFPFPLSPFFSFISTTIRKVLRHWKSAPGVPKICLRPKDRRSLWTISEIMHYSLHRKVASDSRGRKPVKTEFTVYSRPRCLCLFWPLLHSPCWSDNLQVAARFTVFDSLALSRVFFILYIARCFVLIRRWIYEVNSTI